MMIRALLRKQLRELGAAFLRSSKTGKARSRASAMGYALLFAVLVVVLMLCFAGMALPLASVLLPAGLDWLYFASMGLTALLVSVLASAFTSYSGLFQSRDNELLLSLPIPPAVIFGVRVSTVYLACLIYLLMAWVPAVVCYGLLATHPLAGVLCSIPMALVLAGAACILAVLLGWAVALANDRARHKSLVTVVCSLVFFALYYAGFLRVQEMLDDLLAVLGRPEPELELRVARQIILVPFSRIEYALAQNHYVSVRTGEGEYRATATFAPIQQSLCADPRFLLCNRGVVVNMDKVLRFESDAIQMLNGMSFPVRQKDKGRLFAAFTQYQFRHMRREL